MSCPRTGSRGLVLATPKLGEREVVAPCWTVSATGCGPGWSSWPTRGSLGGSSNNWSPAMAPSCCSLTASTSHSGMGRWAVSTVDREHLPDPQGQPGWNGMAGARWPAWGSASAAAARPRRRHLVELGDQRPRQALPGRLRPLTPHQPIGSNHLARQVAGPMRRHHRNDSVTTLFNIGWYNGDGRAVAVVAGSCWVVVGETTTLAGRPGCQTSTSSGDGSASSPRARSG